MTAVESSSAMAASTIDPHAILVDNRIAFRRRFHRIQSERGRAAAASACLEYCSVYDNDRQRFFAVLVQQIGHDLILHERLRLLRKIETLDFGVLFLERDDRVITP